jgi:hypothetical protein
MISIGPKQACIGILGRAKFPPAQYQPGNRSEIMGEPWVGENWRPDWSEVMKDCGGVDKRANELVMVTRETVRLAMSAIAEQQKKDAYHNFSAAYRELDSVLTDPIETNY